MKSPRRPADPILNKVLGHIAATGWSVTAVGAGQHTPQFAYTTGLTAQDKPELVIAGLPFEEMHAILNQVAAGGPYRHGQRLSDVLTGGYQVQIREGAPTEALHPGTAYALYGRDRVTVLQQVLWPDAAGRMPGEPGFTLADLQPLLARAF
jgi:hypothetical protein